MRHWPALASVVTFLALIAIGTLALACWGFVDPARGGLLRSVFTATSAVCVTGLTIVDLSRDMDARGQLIVLLLLQAGGLGVLTLSNWVLLSLRGRVGVYGALLTAETVVGITRFSPRRILPRIVAYTLVAESVGTALLFLRFRLDLPPGEALWSACFHAVSAFCNAGFSIFGNSLSDYRGDVLVNVTVMGLIVAGGLGFVAAVDIVGWTRNRLRRRRTKLAFHTRVVLGTTGILLGAGLLLFLVFEWGNSFTGEHIGGGLLESMFLSVTARTAGFNTVATGHLTNMSLLLLMLLMVIGASPGSTGGGIKTTALAIIWARTRAQLGNRADNELMGASIPREMAAKSVALLVLYMLVVVLALVALQATEFGELPHDQSRGLFLEHAFEVISATSTVGLSTGITSRLSDAGLGVLMVCMFAGRVGPLVLAASLVGERRRLPYERAQEDIMVG